MDNAWLDELLSEEPEISLSYFVWIGELINRSVLTEDHKLALEAEMGVCNMQRLQEMASYLSKNQIDRIENGLNYNQTDIKKKLAQLRK
jgi:hypothetical protein